MTAPIAEGVATGVRGGSRVATRTAETGRGVAGKNAAPVRRFESQQRGYSQPVVTDTRSRGVRTGERLQERSQRPARKSKTALVDFEANTGMIAAEYLAALFIVFLGVLRKDKGYHDKMHSTFFQLTGISAVYFLLALLSVGKKSARFAVTFGLLIDLAILLWQAQAVNTSRKNADAAILAGTLLIPAGGAALGAAATAAIDNELDTPTNAPSTVVAPVSGS